jgi:pimeloyl-ACP methyl ester carboxylesterase/DNA-binding CsgD family transcriptional regulator
MFDRLIPATTMQTPQTRYAKSGAVRIAYQVVGQGPLDLVFVPGFLSNLEVHWEDEGFCHLLNRLATFTRLILLDKRGTGLSDRVDAEDLPSLETRMDDVRAVMDAAGSGRAALLGASEGAPMSMLFAATYPERTRALVLYGGYAHFHTWVMSEEALAKFVSYAETAWGSGTTVANFAPEQAKDERFRAWWARFERLSVSPTAAMTLARMNARIDVRHVLPSIRVPTLVLHRKHDARVRFAAGRYLAEKIASAQFVGLPGRDHPIWTGDIDSVVDEIEEFLTGAKAAPAHNRVLATIVMARLVAPERLAIRLGDLRWSERMQTWQSAARGACARHGGQGFGGGVNPIAIRFDGPARAVRCALALREMARTLELELAIGVHVGEVELHDDAVSGLAVHIAERIAACADAGEVLVSSLARDLVAGSGLHFAERRTEIVEGFDGSLRLLAVVTEQHLQPVARAPASANLDALSVREHEVLKLVAEGMSNAAIAEHLHLSDHTVKRHVANILLKLDLPTRAAAAALMGRWLSP